MRYILAWIAAFFPFLHGTRYEVNLHACSEEQILVEYEESVFPITLFNVWISEEGQKQVCPLLEQAKRLEIEADAVSAIEEPLDVYVFADGKLVQSILLEREIASVAIRNPQYRYAKEMQDATQSEETISTAVKQRDVPDHTRGNLILGFSSMVWASVFVFFLYRCAGILQAGQIHVYGDDCISHHMYHIPERTGSASGCL